MMNIERERKKLLELHTEYESMVRFFSFAHARTKPLAEKENYRFREKICRSMLVVIECLLKLLGEKEP